VAASMHGEVCILQGGMYANHGNVM
jgi:hypothetical protein